MATACQLCAGVSAAHAAADIWLIGAQRLASPASVEMVTIGASVGVCGAMNRTLDVLDVGVGTYAVQHDVDTSALGDEKGFVSTVNRLRFPLSERVSDDLERALVDTGARAVRGAIASGDQFVSEPDAKAAIAERFGASVCEMEGGAIAHVCLLNEIPCCILRAISDGADDGAALTYAEFAERAAHVSAKAMIRYPEAYA